ncbi:MAG: glycosyltransferase family A protein [Kiritimatiellae bacterium]|nr:glycosyltransferase family A protein [Kiritimatiellia bacterium]
MPEHVAFEVSVVIPVYNAVTFVARAVASALLQPEAREVLLVEDGSSDGSLAECARLAAAHPDRVRLLRHPDGANHGSGATRNVGIRASTCPFVAFLDADDYYLADRFRRDAELLLSDEALDGVYNALGVEFLDDRGRAWWQADGTRPLLTTVRGRPSPERLYFEVSPIGGAGMFSFDAATLRRAAFDKSAYFSDLRLAQDTLLMMQLAARCRLAAGETDKPVAMRGVHANNSIRDSARMHRAAQEVFEIMATWARMAPLPAAHRTALHQAWIRTAPDWRTVRRALRAYPPAMAHPRTLVYVARWVLCRRTADDIYLPGVFPHLRGRLATGRSLRRRLSHANLPQR